MHFTTALAAAVLVGSAAAHPGHNVKAEALERKSFIESKPRSVATCASKLKARGHTDRGIQRRAALAKDIMAKRGLKARDSDTVLATDHQSNLTGITTDVDEATLFASNSSCVLQPDVTEGPYYVSGELIRQDVREGQSGVDAYVYVQVVDVSTCDPVDNLYIDFWHCNSTGVYGGVVASGNGNSDDATIINSTAFRGIQATDSDGVAEFISVVPGHYVGRTNHIHIMVHQPNDTQVFANGTLGTEELIATHVGQIFFDQSLISEVEAVSPYSTNNQTVTTNAEDSILLSEADSSDPMLEYVLLGDTVADGILGWVTVGVDMSSSVNVSNAAYVDADGGHAVSGGFGGGGGPPPTKN